MANIYEKIKVNEASSISRESAEFIYSFLLNKKIQKSLETGFGSGVSTAYIMSATNSIHYAIDPNQEKNYSNIGLANIKSLNLNKNLKFFNDYSHNVLPKLHEEGLKIDFAFIDGEHLFEYTMVDFFYIDLMLNENGYVMFDDIWMRSIQLVASFIKNNRDDYRLIDTPIKNLILFQKVGKDKRKWDYFKEFYVTNLRGWVAFDN